MQPVHHVVMATDKAAIDPGSLDDRQFDGPYEELPTNPVRLEGGIAFTGETHRERAAGHVISAEVPGELHVERANCLVWIRVARDPPNGVDRHRRVRTVTQVYGRQAEIGPTNHGVIAPLQQDDERGS